MLPLRRGNPTCAGTPNPNAVANPGFGMRAESGLGCAQADGDSSIRSSAARRERWAEGRTGSHGAGASPWATDDTVAAGEGGGTRSSSTGRTRIPRSGAAVCPA
jgi:hypothetical protein